LKSVLPRIKKLGKDGLDIAPPGSGWDAEEVKKEAEEAARSTAIGGHDLMFPAETMIATQSVDAELQSVPADSQIQFLRNSLATWRVLWLFENIYAAIFGSQIKLLRLLNQRGAGGIGQEELTNHWEEYRNSVGAALNAWTMDD
jgi:hypothetical protein